MIKVGCLILTVSLLIPAAQASSVVQVTFTELVSSSEFIFEGRVIDKRAELDSRGMIHTYVTFEVRDVLKGTYSGRTLVLPYLGGTVGEITLHISDLQPPDTGEKGIYFVESISRPPVHPLYGWDQGHFLVLTDATDRLEHVFSRNRKPVVGFESRPGKATGLSTGVATGLLLADPNRSNQAVTVYDFRQKIRELLPR